MVAKVEMVEMLGERAVLLPALIEQALAANDRAKVRLTVLQEASAKVADPSRASPPMEAELRAAGLDDPAFAATIFGARRVDDQSFVAPGAARLAAGLASDLCAMLAPIEAAGSEQAGQLRARLDAALKALPEFRDDRVTRAEVANLGSVRRERGDTLHLLLMDLHRELNRVAAAVAVEDIDGAHAHGLDERDRERVRAFMRGLNRTARLAFGHPGLGTTAARVGSRLTIQNDIGMTDAHVLVVHVDGPTATTTYTDVHRIRAKFFMSLFDAEAVVWSALAENKHSKLAEGEAFYLVTGAYTAESDADLDRFLEFLGSRIVFLIDWNKARKALQSFVSKSSAIEILRDAARRDDGHRAFLELGGANLVFEAVRRAAAGRIPYGVPLDQAIGERECVGFLDNVLHVASEGLRDGRSARLIRDEIQADFSERLDTAESELLATVLRHLGLTRMLAALIETAFDPSRLASLAERQALARRAKQIEAKGDRLTVAAREIVVRAHDAGPLLSLIDQVENATDAFDEAAFLISLAPENSSGDALSQPLAELAAIATNGAGLLARALEAAIAIPDGAPVDAAFALQNLDAVFDAERDADAAERAAITSIMRASAIGSPRGVDPRALVLGLEIARTLEETTDRLAHAAISLREHVLQGLSA